MLPDVFMHIYKYIHFFLNPYNITVILATHSKESEKQVDEISTSVETDPWTINIYFKPKASI